MVKRADFYLIPENNATAQWRFACRLSEKAFQQNKTVFLHTIDRRHADQLDKLLWTFRDVSFLPHHISDTPIGEPAPIQVGFGKVPSQSFDIMINLSNTVPDFVDQFERVIEIIPDEKNAQSAGRKRFAEYKAAARTMETHDLRNANG